MRGAEERKRKYDRYSKRAKGGDESLGHWELRMVKIRIARQQRLRSGSRVSLGSALWGLDATLDAVGLQRGEPGRAVLQRTQIGPGPARLLIGRRTGASRARKSEHSRASYGARNRAALSHVTFASDFNQFLEDSESAVSYGDTSSAWNRQAGPASMPSALARSRKCRLSHADVVGNVRWVGLSRGS